MIIYVLKGDLCVVTTPDDTHFEIAMAAVRAGLHTLVCKPLVKTLARHRELMAAAEEEKVLLVIEYHKRFDPIYSDAVARMRGLGDFGFFNSYMSQPKTQLETFRSWAGDTPLLIFLSFFLCIDLSHNMQMIKLYLLACCTFVSSFFFIVFF